MSYECVIHGTSIDNVEKIIKSSGLISNSTKSITNYVYSYYVSNKIKIDIFDIYRFLKICDEDFEDSILLIIRPEILRDEPFIACEMEHYGLGCADQSIMTGTGKYKKIPSMKPLLDEINENRLHELVFNKIDLEYIVAIVGESKHKKEVESICDFIPFISIDKDDDCKSKLIKTFQTYGSDKYIIDKPIGKKISTSLFELKKRSYEFAILKYTNKIERIKNYIDELKEKDIENSRIIVLTKDLKSTKKKLRESKKAYDRFMILSKTRKKGKGKKE